MYADEFVRRAVRVPVGGERSGLTAHFFFGPKLGDCGAILVSSSGGTIRRDWLVTDDLEKQNGKRKHRGWKLTMAVKLDEIRKAADRVASSLGLEVVDVEFTGAASSRILCVYLEKDAAGRARQAEAMGAKLKARQTTDEGSNSAEPEDTVEEEPAVVIPERFAKGELDLKQLSWLTHQDCAAFSRDFGILLDVEDLVPESEYTLEASSPGLDRKLNGKDELARFTGNLVKVQTVEPIRNNRHWQGKLAAVDGNSITLDLASAKQNSKSRKAGVSTVEIALSNIEKAQLVPEF